MGAIASAVAPVLIPHPTDPSNAEYVAPLAIPRRGSALPEATFGVPYSVDLAVFGGTTPLHQHRPARGPRRRRRRRQRHAATGRHLHAHHRGRTATSRRRRTPSRYGSNQYNFAWDTASTVVKGCYTVALQLSDGSVKATNVLLK